MFRPFLLLAVIALLTGCSAEEPIVTHKIAKSRSGLDAFREASAKAPAAPQVRTRMLVALFELPEATWFFKVTGPEKQLAELEESCRAFFATIRFEGQDPAWDQPEGWRVGPEKPLRFATLYLDDSNPPVELAISSLSAGQDLTLNINRWRGQLGLPPIAAENVAQELTPAETTAGQKYLLFDATGSGSGQMGGPPFAGGMAPPVAAPQPQDQLDFKAPDGWEVGPTSSMVPARLSRTLNDQQLQITVVKMPADANDWLPNVQRWAQQVSLTLDEAQIQEQTTTVTVAGQEGQRISLLGDSGDPPGGLVGVMVKRGPWAWFFKLAGPAEQVSAATADFDQFLSSIEFQ